MSDIQIPTPLLGRCNLAEVIQPLNELWDAGLESRSLLAAVSEIRANRALGTTCRALMGPVPIVLRRRLYELEDVVLTDEQADQLFAALDEFPDPFFDEIMDALEAAARAEVAVRFDYAYAPPEFAGVSVEKWYELRRQRWVQKISVYVPRGGPLDPGD